MFEKPKVALISTGNEIVDSYDANNQDKIRDSNGPMLSACLHRMNYKTINIGIVPDE